MKKIILILLFFIAYAISKANNDSLDAYLPDVVDELLMQSYNTPQTVNSKTEHNANPVLKHIWKSVTAPFKPVWGTYSESDHRPNGPYTVFQHHKGNISEQVVAIRQKILAKDPVYFTLYAEIYITAVNGQTSNL